MPWILVEVVLRGGGNVVLGTVEGSLCVCVHVSTPFPFHFLPVSLTVQSPWCAAIVGSWEGGEEGMSFGGEVKLFILSGLEIWHLPGFLDNKPLACC